MERCYLHTLPEEYTPKYDPNRELGQAAANAAQERHSHGEIVGLVRRIVASELADRKESGANQHGAVQIALTKVSKAFGKSLGWANNYHMLNNLSDQLIDMLDEGEDGSEAKLKWGDAISLAPVEKGRQMSLLTEALAIFPNDPQARRTYISNQSRSERAKNGEKVKGRAYDNRQRFINYQRQLRTIAARVAEGRERADNLAHMKKLVDGMRVTELEEMIRDLKYGLDPFVNLYRLAKSARDRKLEESDLRVSSTGEVAVPDVEDGEHDEVTSATNM